jgi:hypothetical protein
VTLTNEDRFHNGLPAHFDGLFDWDFLIPAFKEATGRNITPMDIDAHVEIGGNHLFFETKSGDTPVPPGQLQALHQLWAKGYVTVILLWGKNTGITNAEIWYPNGRKRKYNGPLTKTWLFEQVKHWAEWADKKYVPFQYKEPRLREPE